MINRNAILAGGIKPHYYCLPVAKARKPSPGAAQGGNLVIPVFSGH
jgi:dihydroorotase